MSALALARADWLTLPRARLYGLALGALGAALVSGILIRSALHADMMPRALDFAAFWATAHLAIGGHPEAAYDPVAIEAMERSATIMPQGYLAFYYPPPFLVLLLPLGLLGYGAALAVFLVAGTGLALAALRRLLPRDWGWLPLLVFPGFLMNGLAGQNATLSIACFAGAALWLDRRPGLAGVCLGALACKPQLAACMPFALVAARRWRALVAFIATALALAALSWPVLGSASWHGFLAGMALARTDIETIAIKWPRMQSLFGAVRLAGDGNFTAYAAQALWSAAALSILVWVCLRRPGARLEAACQAAAALLVTPFLYDYDLAILAVPLACLAAHAAETVWRRWEKPVMAALFMTPLAAPACALGLGITVGPLLVAALLAVIVGRVRAR